jgi:molybdate transport system substrate-binding protein
MLKRDHRDARGRQGSGARPRSDARLNADRPTGMPWKASIDFSPSRGGTAGHRDVEWEGAMRTCAKFTRTCANFATLCILGVLGSSPQGAAVAADLIILTNQGATPGVREIAAAFSRATGNKVTVIQEAGAALDRRLANGPADLITGNPEPIEDLVKKGRVVAGTAVPFALASLGVSVRAGAPKPDISTVEAYKAALLAAKSIGYSRGCSGTHAAEGIAELGIADQLKSKTVFTENGPVVEYLAKGDFEIGIQQTNIMVGAPGTDYVGVPPGFLNKPCPSSVALLPISKNPDAARAMMKFMTSPEAAPLLRKTLVEPAKP